MAKERLLDLINRNRAEKGEPELTELPHAEIDWDLAMKRAERAMEIIKEIEESGKVTWELMQKEFTI